MNNILEYIIKIKDQYSTGLLRSGNNISKAMAGARHEVHKVGEEVKGIEKIGQRNPQGLLKGLFRIGGTAAALAGLRDSIQQAAKMEGIEAAIKFTTKDNTGAGMDFVKEQANKLGLDLESSLSGYKTLTGGLRAFNMAQEDQRKIFVSVSEAATAMRLSGEDAEGVYLALSQIASKGVVSAEELRGQMGERIPGAFSLAAQAMGVTEGALGDMLKKGELMAKDFLPVFAQKLHDTFGVAAQEASGGATANFNRFNSALLKLRVTIGQKLLPVVIPFLTNFLIPAVEWVGRNIDVLMSMAAAIGVVIAGIKIWGIVQVILNVALWANPIGLIIGAIAALVGIIVHVIRNKEAWRKKMVALWGVIKSFGRMTVEVFKDIWEGIRYWLSLAGLKVAEFVDIALQKVINLSQAMTKALTFDFTGASEAWNRKEKSTYTDKIATLDKKHAASNRKSRAAIAGEMINQLAGMGEVYKPFRSNGKKGSSWNWSGGSGGFAGAGGTGAGGAGKGKGKAKGLAKHGRGAATSITGGGARNIYITLGKFMDTLNINTTQLKGGTLEAERQVEAMFLRVLNSAGAITN